MKSSSCPAFPSGGLFLLWKCPQELLASQQHLAPASSDLLRVSSTGGWASMTLQTQKPGYRFTPQCWQAREANGQGRKKWGRCERDEKNPNPQLHAFSISISPGKICRNMCGWGGNENRASSCISLHPKNAGKGSPCPSAISDPVAMCWGRCLWQYDILGPSLERQRWGHSKVSRAG